VIHRFTALVSLMIMIVLFYGMIILYIILYYYDSEFCDNACLSYYELHSAVWF